MASPDTQTVTDIGIIPPPDGVTPNFIDPEYSSGGIVPICAVFLTLSTIFLVLRVYTKAHIIKIFGLEDCQFQKMPKPQPWN